VIGRVTSRGQVVIGRVTSRGQIVIGRVTSRVTSKGRARIAAGSDWSGDLQRAWCLYMTYYSIVALITIMTIIMTGVYKGQARLIKQSILLSTKLLVCERR